MTPPASILVAVPKPGRAAKTRKPLRKVNSRRRRRALAEDFGALAAFVRTLPCLVIGCRREPIDAAHVRSRGAGHHAWLALAGERIGNIVPLCRYHHDEQGRHGVSRFEASYRLGIRWPLGGTCLVDTMAKAGETIGCALEPGAT